MEAVKPRRTKTKKIRELSPSPLLPSDLALSASGPSVSSPHTSDDLKRSSKGNLTTCSELPSTSENVPALEESKITEGEETVNDGKSVEKKVSFENRTEDIQQFDDFFHNGNAAAFNDVSLENSSCASEKNPSSTEDEIVPVVVPGLDLFPLPINKEPVSPFLMEDGKGDEVSNNDGVPTQRIYPSTGDIKPTIPSTLPPVVPCREAPPIPTISHVPPKLECCNLYPFFPQSFPASDQLLMTENQLLGFYHNELYEATEDFVDSFIENENCPQNELFEYLERYKAICQKVSEAEVEIKECESLIKDCSGHIWTAEKHICHQSGKCGDQKHATGSIEYLSATLHSEKVTELGDLLKSDAKGRLDGSLCYDIEARSLALQIQWHIVSLNNEFMAEFGVAATSLPQFTADGADTPSRFRIRGALSDLFHFLRFPSLPSRFVNSVTGWITELCAVLLKACTYFDQHFILCQVLRLAPPVSNWAASLVQTYTNISSGLDRLIIDNFISMLSILLSPIRGRETFLKRILSFEEEENSWAILSEDLDEGEISLAAVSEVDMISFLNQFRIEAVFAKAIQQFSSLYWTDSVGEFLSLIAFELVLMKIFNDGLRAYSHPRFRQFCKQIGYSLRGSVKFLAEFWQLKKDTLGQTDRTIAQREFDRIVLQALYYVVGKKSLGLWQFLVDLPYDAVSEACRYRCQILLRNKESLSPLQLFGIPDDELPKHLRSADKLLDRLSSLSKDDSNYMIAALASIISSSESEIDGFLTEVFHMCFIDESNRENFYKVGSEAMGILLDKRPELLSRLLSLIDRNLDSLDQYAVEILTTAPLSKCLLTENDVGSVCGKWLINRLPSHPASRIARRVLSSMNWGFGSDGKLWLCEGVHAVCAETIVKGHMAQCKHTNSLIAKSFNKVAKLASKVPDYEYQFETFCWDVLLRLKLPSKLDSIAPLTDLTAYYVYIIQCCFVSEEDFFSKGLSLWSELVAAGCYSASSAVLAQFLAEYPNSIAKALETESFVQSFDRLLHCDQSSYAIQLIAGSDRFPGPTIRLLEATIAHYISESFSKCLLNSWVRLFCCKRPTEWTSDHSTLYLLGLLCEFCFAKDQLNMLGLIDLFQELYMSSLQQWKSTSKGLFSWLTSDGCLPAAIPSSAVGIVPWVTYTLLLAEERSYTAFYDALYTSLTKHPKYSLEQCVKKASSKSHITLPVERLHFIRWLEFACAESVEKHPCFPLICQNLIRHLFARKSILNSDVCFASQYLSTSYSASLFDKLMKEILPRVEVNTGKENNESALFYKACAQWLANTELRDSKFSAFDKLLLGHLIQRVVVNDTYIWTQFVDFDQITSRQSEGRKLYAAVRHWGVVNSPVKPLTAKRNLVEFLLSLNTNDQTAQFPTVPYHTALPKKIPISVENAQNTDYCLSLFARQLQNVCASARGVLDDILAVIKSGVGRGFWTRRLGLLHFHDCWNANKEYVAAKDRVDSLDLDYIAQFSNLYKVTTVPLQVVLRCSYTFGSKCTHPVTVPVSRSVSQFQTNVESVMNRNRQERSSVLANVIVQLLDSSAVSCAHLEYVAATVVNYKLYGGISKNQLKETGRALFYHLVSVASSLEMLFLASADTFAFVLKKLGETFIANEASEQSRLMNVALNCSQLVHLIAPHFTPECVSPSELVEIYKTLSQAVRTPSSSLALTLLSRLDIKNAGERLPPQQFSELMPFAFESLISISDENSPLYTLCFNHFIHALFHHFPTNFISGLSLSLSACDTNSTPLAVFQTIILNLGAHSFDVNNKPLITIDAKTSLMASDAIANQLVVSRAELGTRLFGIWSKYLEKVCLLSEFFIYKSASLSFNSNFSTSRIEGELQTSFERTVSLFGPLLEPFGPGMPPWNSGDLEVAACVVDKFISLMKRLHLLYDMYLPPGSENLVALLWQYYATKLAVIPHNCAHVYQLLESRLTSMPWHSFWPNLIHLSAMEKVLSGYSPDCASLITQIFVRLPWYSIIQQQAYQQPIDATRALFGLLLSISAHCVSRSSNYSACPASLPKLFAAFSSYDWGVIKTDDLNNVSSYIASSFPPSCITDKNDIISSFFTLFRRICFYSTVPAVGVSLNEEYAKQAVYLRTRLSMMLRNGSDIKWAVGFYRDEIAVVNAIIIARKDVSKLPKCLSHEITACWSAITDIKLGEALVKGLCDWLDINSESHLVLLIMQTVVESLYENQFVTGLKVVEKCIATSFRRDIPQVSCEMQRQLVFFLGASGCKWDTIVEWATLSQSCQTYLFSVPSSEKPVTPLLLTLNVYLLQQLRKCTSPAEETAILKIFFDYMTSLKPKYVEDEAAFIVLVDKLQNLVIRQYSYDVKAGNEFFTSYLDWLEKIYVDDKNTSFFSKLLVKKQPFPLRIRLLCHVLHLYLTQQTVSPEQPPRSSANAAVLNSRIQAFKEMCSMKVYAGHQTTLVQIKPFFFQFQKYHIGHVNELLFALVKSLFSEKYVNNLYEK